MKKILLLFIVISSISLNAQDTITVYFGSQIYGDPQGGMGILALSLPKKNHIKDYKGNMEVKYPSNMVKKDVAIVSIFFLGVQEPQFDRSCALLFVNFKSDTPTIYVDHNYNLDFSDDGEPIKYSDSAIIALENKQFENNFFNVKLTKYSKENKKYHERYLQVFSKNGKDRYGNKIADVSHWYYDMRLNFKKSTLHLDSVTHKFLLYDYNCNGLYNDIYLDGEKNKDLVYLDTTISGRNRKKFIIQKIEKDSTPTITLGMVKYKIIEVQSNGDFMKIVKVDSSLYQDTSNNRGIIDLKIENNLGQINTLFDLLDSTKYTLVDIWGIWCKPCINSLPHLSAVASKFKDSLNVIGVHYGAQMQDVAKVIEKNNIFWPTYYVSNTELELYNVDGFPTYLLFDKKKNLLFINSNLNEIEFFLKSKKQ